MEKNKVENFYNAIYRIETVLYALKWLHSRYNNIWEFMPILDEFSNSLKQLKIECFNNIGDIEDL